MFLLCRRWLIRPVKREREVCCRWIERGIGCLIDDNTSVQSCNKSLPSNTTTAHTHGQIEHSPSPNNPPEPHPTHPKRLPPSPSLPNATRHVLRIDGLLRGCTLSPCRWWMWPCFLGGCAMRLVTVLTWRRAGLRRRGQWVSVPLPVGGVGLETRSTIAELVFCL